MSLLMRGSVEKDGGHREPAGVSAGMGNSGGGDRRKTFEVKRGWWKLPELEAERHRDAASFSTRLGRSKNAELECWAHQHRPLPRKKSPFIGPTGNCPAAAEGSEM